MLMRVMHVITRMIIGGAQENTLLNCLDLRQQYGDEVLLVTGPTTGPEGELLAQGRAGELPIEVIDWLRRPIRPWDDWRALTALGEAIRRFRPDVVHTHSAKGGFLGRRAAWAGRVPAIVHTVHGAPFHAYQPAPVRWLYRACERRAAAWCHHFISVADAMTDLMVDAGVAAAEKFVTIRSGMDVEPLLAADRERLAVRRRLGIKDHEVVVGKIARLFHLKGHDDLITAAASVVAAHRNVRFLLVGDGILQTALRQRIAELGLSQQFLFAGLVSPEEVPELIGAMDLLVHTSLREGLARALPQALIAARPVVSYDIDGAREVVIDGRTGYLVRPADTEMLAARIGWLAADAAARRRMGQHGRELFTEPFRHQTMTRQIRQLYQRLLDQPRHG